MNTHPPQQMFCLWELFTQFAFVPENCSYVFFFQGGPSFQIVQGLVHLLLVSVVGPVGRDWHLHKV